MVDYKAQSSNTKVETDAYLDSIYHQGYKIQMDIYVHILRKMGFNVSDTSYFYVCNAEKGFDNFEGKLNFTITLVPYVTDTSWVENNIKEMKKKKKKESDPKSVPNLFTSKYIVYYYGFFWAVLISIVVFS